MPQPLADVAGMPGAGRLVNQMVQSVTNPKDSHQKQKEKEQRKQQQQQEDEQQSEQEQLEQAAAVVADGEAVAGELQEGAADAAAGAEAAAAAVPEALAAAVTSQQLQQQQVSEWTEEEVAPKTVQQRYEDTVRFLTTTGTGKGISIAAGLFLGATFVIALYRTYQKYSSPRAQRKRMVGVRQTAAFLHMLVYVLCAAVTAGGWGKAAALFGRQHIVAAAALEQSSCNPSSNVEGN
jgi:hypothetical protein